jgi:hypothetical protein
MMSEASFVPLAEYREYPVDEMKKRAAEFYSDLRRRRTVRDFSDRPVPRQVIEACLLAAGTAPNGANLQPWHFVAVCDPDIKKQIREAAEKEEREFYAERAPQEWLEALAPLGTDANKQFLEIAPYLIVIFVQNYGFTAAGRKIKHYYAAESVGIATGHCLRSRRSSEHLVRTTGRVVHIRVRSFADYRRIRDCGSNAKSESLSWVAPRLIGRQVASN